MEQYNNILIKKMVANISILVLLIVMMIAIVVGAVVLVRLGEKKKLVLIVIMAVAIILTSLYTCKSGMKYYCDIKNQSYIMYTGEVEIGTLYGFGTIAYLNDENETWLYVSRWEIDPGSNSSYNGKYQGSIIYAKHSKTIVLWACHSI